jgi:beta-galactosidase/beta-glucuronidase
VQVSPWNPDPKSVCPARVNPVLCHPQERRVSLDGEWLLFLDPKDAGRNLDWHKSPYGVVESVQVPGCWQGQGKGHEGEDEIWDFRLKARTFRATYCGTAWYCRHFRPPEAWRGGRIWLNFGGVRPAAEVWVNGQELGSHCAPFVPFAFDVTDAVSFERENLLVVRVHEANRWLGLSLNWQGNWSGLFRSVELSATGNAWLERFWVYPDADSGKLRVQALIQGAKGSGTPLQLQVGAAPVGGKSVA